MNYHAICRICINENSHMISVFESHNFSTIHSEIFKVITDCASVQIQPFDGFSQKICLKCLDHLSQAYSFKKLCEESDYKFRNDLIIGDGIEIKSEFNDENTTITYGDMHNNVIVNTDETRKKSDFDSVKVKEEISEEDTVINYGETHNERYENLTKKRKIIDFEFADVKAEQSDDENTPEMKLEQDEVEETDHLRVSCDEFESAEYEGPSSLKKSQSEEDDTSDSPHKCNICAKEFSRGSSLASHMRVHTGEEQHNYDILLKSIEVTKLIPQKSSDRYIKEFQLFCEWRTEKKVNTVTEDVILAYLLHMSKKLSSASLWSKYSMVKSMLLVQENVDISSFTKVIVFLKKMSVGYQPTQSKLFTRDEFHRFLKEANDKEYLLAKVVSILGIAGGCRREELHNLSLEDVQDTGTQLVVTILQAKTFQKRVFTIMNEVDGIKFVDIIRKYISLRPKNLGYNKLLIRFRNGKGIAQRVGIHTIGGIPKKIATYLNLQNPEKYTWHCFRQTSANADADLTVSKRHGGWKSSTVGEKCNEKSMEGIRKIARMIQGGENFMEVLQEQSTSISTTTSMPQTGNIPNIN